LTVKGGGIEAALDRLRVFENDIVQAEAAGDHRGVTLVANAANQNGPEGTQILNNRITGFPEAAIVARVPDLRALEIKGNQIEGVGEGVVLEVQGLADQVVIENNQFSKVRGFAIRGGERRARILTSGNQIETEGGHPAVQLLFEMGENVFTDNLCRRGESAANIPDVALGGHTVIVTSNRVDGGPRSIDLHVDTRRYTLLGNIAHGTITVNNAPPEPKWQPLNLQNI
jgi:hypothetical protein